MRIKSVSIEEEKATFRSASIKRLQTLGAHQRYYSDKVVMSLLYHHIVQRDARRIMLYMPLDMEVNIYPLIVLLRRQKRQLYLPFMEGDSFRLVKYRLPLKKGAFGVKEPKDSKQYDKKSIDLAIVPIVGIDAEYRRIGFGKGMYDRFFEKNSKYIKESIFVSRRLCQSKERLSSAHDIEADIIVKV
jgi:5-formyltetrahydrofolate cyclo-ligase